VTEDKAALLEWAETQGPWFVEGGEDEEETATRPPPMLKREMSSGLRTLKSLRQRLQDVSGFAIPSRHPHCMHCFACHSFMLFTVPRADLIS
jgi:hypothetical protein